MRSGLAATNRAALSAAAMKQLETSLVVRFSHMHPVSAGVSQMLESMDHQQRRRFEMKRTLDSGR
jgi:hypothetical protein